MKQSIRKIIKLYRLAGVHRFRAPLLKGVGAAIEHKAILLWMNEIGIDQVFDIGANVGQFSLAAREYIPDANILAFEPQTKPAEVFQSIFTGDQMVSLVKTAIGTENGQVTMHISQMDDSSSLLSIGQKQRDIFPGTDERGIEKVSIGPLSSFVDMKQLKGSALLKIDVQGFELEVLKASEILLDGMGAIYVECSFAELYIGQALAHQVIDWLSQRGWKLVHTGVVTFDTRGRSIQSDLLFLRKPI